MFIKSIFKLLGKQILDSIGFTEKMGGDIGNFEISPIVKMNDGDFRDFKAELDRIDKDPVQVDVLLKTRGLEQIQDLKEYILKNDVKQDSVNEFIETQNFTNIANQAHGFSGVKKAIDEYNASLNKTDVDTNKFVETIGKSNAGLGKYLAGLKGGQAGLLNYGISLVGATIKTVALQAATTALNMAISMGVSLAIGALFKGIDYLIHRTEKMQEALQNSVDEFNTATDELKSLEEELETTSERLNELQKLADNGTISVAEEAELETLKETNKELARKIALKQQEQANEARDVLKDSKKNTNSTVASKYENKTTASGNYTYGVSITPDKELELAIKAYETSSKALENNRGTNLEGFYEDQIESAKNRIEENKQ